MTTSGRSRADSASVSRDQVEQIVSKAVLNQDAHTTRRGLMIGVVSALVGASPSLIQMIIDSREEEDKHEIQTTIDSVFLMSGSASSWGSEIPVADPAPQSALVDSVVINLTNTGDFTEEEINGTASFSPPDGFLNDMFANGRSVGTITHWVTASNSVIVSETSVEFQEILEGDDVVRAEFQTPRMIPGSELTIRFDLPFDLMLVTIDGQSHEAPISGTLYIGHQE